MFIAVGDDEYQNPNPTDYTHDLDFEAHILYKWAEHTPHLSSELRVLNGGHDWDVWAPAFEEGAQYAFQYVARPEVTIMKAKLVGTPGEDREGGVATDAAGNVYEALSAEGAVDGQPNAGAKDVVLIKYGPAGNRIWTKQFGTAGVDRPYGLQLDPQGHPVIVGYTKGDLDGNHAGNTSDDLFVAKVDPNGNREWTTQVGTTAADRGYGLAIDPAGAIYAGGYTKGALGGPLVGDKDVILLKLAATGGAPLWIDQFGTIGEDKGMAVAAGGGVRLRRRHGRRRARHAGPGHDAGRRRRLPRAGRRERHADVDAPARHVRRRAALGRRRRRRGQRHRHRLHLRRPLRDERRRQGRRRRALRPGGLDDAARPARARSATTRARQVALDGAGNTYVSGFSDGNFEANVGNFDALLIKYGPGLTRQWARQFGTTESDGADAFAEGNVFLATRGTTIWASGFTLGSTATQTQAGNGDVFLTSFDDQGTNLG